MVNHKISSSGIDDDDWDALDDGPALNKQNGSAQAAIYNNAMGAAAAQSYQKPSNYA